MSDFRLGIVGGMGPMAGVYLQKLIVEATPADSDQDHLQVLCFTNPQIPDRTAALLRGGPSYVEEVVSSIRVLEKAGATHALLACHTAHAKIEKIRELADIPVMDLVKITLDSIQLSEGSKIGLLATSGTLKTGVYSSYPDRSFQWILPGREEETALMETIYRIKAGDDFDPLPPLRQLIKGLADRGAQAVILGCTELSMYHDLLQAESGILVDPLRVAARHVVGAALRSRLSLAHAQ